MNKRNIQQPQVRAVPLTQNQEWQSMAQRFLIILCLIMLPLVLSQQARAEVEATAEPSNNLTYLMHKLNLLGNEIAMHFHLYSAEQGDPKSAERMKEASDQADSLAGELKTGLENASLADSGKAVDTEWKAFQKLLNQNRSAIKSNGFAENQLVTDMLSHLRGMESAISESKTAYLETPGANQSSRVEEIRKQSLLMQVIATRYAERSSNMWGSNSSGDEEATLDQMASEFSQSLRQLTSDYSSSEQASTSLKQVNTRWKFIEKSLMNYTENSIPFLVTRYSRKIVESLEDVASVAEE